MAIGLDRLRESQPWTARDLRRWIVPLSIVTVVALRLPFLTHAPTPDEAGFLLVGGQWHPGGSSLYGNYWVDRPPLLIGIFQIASALGGLPALRLIGCFAAAATVGGSSLAAGLVAGKRASRWAAIAAAALCTTPLLGTVAVNGELLAGPFVVAGIAAAIGALKTDDEGRARLFGIAAGAAAISAMMIKQNFADVFVFGLVATVVAWHRRDIGTARFFRVLSSAIAGAALALFALAVFTLAQGTSLSGVYDAMYPFRFEADRVIAAGGSQYATARLFTMLLAAAASGIVLLFAAAGWGIAAKRLYGAAAWGLVATLAFDTVSVASGGAYWTHYLIEPIAPLAIVTGILIARRQPFVRPIVALTAIAAVISSAIWLSVVKPSTGSDVGHAIQASARPGDTIITIYGHADVVQTSGLSSPYPFLWSLPVKARDPQLNDLSQVLSGPQAPTWFVKWKHIASWGVEPDQVRAIIARDYRLFGHVCGHPVYLREGVTRPRLHAQAKCPNLSVVKTITKDELP